MQPSLAGIVNNGEKPIPAFTKKLNYNYGSY